MKRRHYLSMPSWMNFSKKVHSRMAQPLHAGTFHPEEATARRMRLVQGQEGKIADGYAVRLSWLVDESDGIIVDALFEAFGPPALIAAADLACEVLMRKNYEQARRISADILDRQGRDKNDEPAFPEYAGRFINLVLFAIEEAADQCMDIPFADTYVSSPIDPLSGLEGDGYPNWKELSKAQKLAVLDEVIGKDIQPYVQLDAGGVQVVDLLHDHEVIIAYQGSCTSCLSATGSTLSAIQQILRVKVSPDILVTPDLSLLQKH